MSSEIDPSPVQRHTMFPMHEQSRPALWHVVIVILGLGALTFWPVAVYWSRIRFDPARFTEEWLKLISTGVVLYFLLQTVDEIRRRRELSAYWSKLVKDLLLKPLANIRTTLEQIKPGSQPPPDKLEGATRSWKATKEILDRLAEDASIGEANQSRIKRVANSEIVRSFDATLLPAYARCTMGEVLDKDQHAQLLEKLKRLEADLHSIGGAA